MRVDCGINSNMIRTSLKPFGKPISFSNKIIKFLGLGALLLSGSALAEGLKARAIKAAPLALSCRDMCPLNPQTSSGNSTIPHMPGQNMSFIDTYLQPECEGGYQIFSQQMLRFLHAGYYSILVEPAFLSNNQWICQIQGEHHKPLNCVKNFNEIKYNIDHQTGRRPPRTERSPQIMNHYPQAEVSAFRLAVGYAQTHILQNPVFFDQPNETIIHHIKQLNGIMRQFEQPVLGKPYEFRNDRVIVSDQDKIIPDFHRLYPHATKAEIAEVTSLLDLAKSNRITEMLERIESSPKQLAVWHNLVGNIPPHHNSTVCEMNKLIDKFKHEIQEGIHPYVIASEFYLEFTNIHPFPDGNGRTARLFLNTFLASQGFQPLVFSDKQEFDHYHDKSRLEPKSLIEYFFMMVGWNIRNYKYLT